MALKNSDFRNYAIATQAPQSSGRTGWVLAALAVIVPAAGIYLFKPQLMGLMSGVSGRPQANVAAAAPAAPAPAAPAAPAKPAAAPAPPPASGKPVVASASDPQNTLTDDQRRRYASATMRIFMSSDLTEEFVSTMIQTMDETTGNRNKLVNPNDLFAYCRQQTRGLATSNYVRKTKDDDTSFVDMMTESLICAMTRRPDRLCEPQIRTRLIRQIGLYAGVRDEAVAKDTKTGETLAKAAEAGLFERAVHRTAHKEIRTLASKGFISVKDFGWSAPKYLAESIGEFKGVKPACGA